MKPTTIILNREQVTKLGEIAKHFPHVSRFVLEADSRSGIGVEVRVLLTIFRQNDIQIDITDVKDW